MSEINLNVVLSEELLIREAQTFTKIGLPMPSGIIKRNGNDAKKLDLLFKPIFVALYVTLYAAGKCAGVKIKDPLAQKLLGNPGNIWEVNDIIVAFMVFMAIHVLISQVRIQHK